MKEAMENLAREQARLQAEKRMREELGIPEYPCLTLRLIKHDHIIPVPCEPRIKVSPYAKFDKYHKKKRR